MEFLYPFAYAVVKPTFHIFFTLFCRMRVEGRKWLCQPRLPGQGGALVAANHLSYLDPLVLAAAAMRPMYFMAKSELFQMPILGPILRGVRVFPVHRGSVDRAALRTCEELVRAGQLVVIFAEGTRSATGRLEEFEPGVGLLALRTRAPVVPIGISGTDRVLPRNIPMLLPGKIEVRIGPPVSFPDLYDRPIERETVAEATRRLMLATAALLPRRQRPDWTVRSSPRAGGIDLGVRDNLKS
jgi:1-acyl-sn-glycerol-3-phosphate acyltransferase